ncbi:methyltransferase [Candidatus Woesearchaeota archaeon]|nr:methyltransferase [Candidatus Woesearchaeota archaeon]
MHESIYEPAEDSYLLQKAVEKYAFGKVLDVGTGSGIQALTALKLGCVKDVTALDLNPEVIKHLQTIKKQRKLSRLKVIHSDLFENVPKQQFDVIIFNAPYLPQGRDDVADMALYGGKKGWEISERFFEQVDSYLSSNGIILFLFSTLTNKNKIEEILRNHLLDWVEVGRHKISFEELYVYKITKSQLHQELEQKWVSRLGYCAKGKRGVVYVAYLRKKKVAIKVQRADSGSLAALDREAQMLRIVNTKQIGPKLIDQGKDYIIIEFVEGLLFEEWLKNQSSPIIHKMLNAILMQCYILDTLKITKEEMHHPFKHIIITKTNKPVFLDFERAKYTDRPTNVTQVVEYFCRLERRLKLLGVEIDCDILRKLSFEYKQGYSKDYFQRIVRKLS